MVQEAKSPVKISSMYIYLKFLALLGAPYVYDISRLRVKRRQDDNLDDKMYDGDTDNRHHKAFKCITMQ
jgi:hypothetical protein